MSTFLLLLKIRLISFVSAMTKGSRKKRARGIGFKILIGILAVYILVVFFGLFGMLFSQLQGPFFANGLGWLYFALMGLIAAMLCFVGSVFATQTQIFEARDNELLLSMPISPSVILASRMAALVVLNYLYELFVVVPAGVVYCIYQPVTLSGVVIFLVAVLFLPFLVMAISSLFAWLIALISSKIRFKNAMTLILWVAFFILYFLFFSQMQQYIAALIANGAAIGQAVQRYLFPAYHFGIAIAQSNLFSLVLYLACAVIPFLLVSLLIAKNFIKIATTKKGGVRVRYREKSVKILSAKRALVKKEITHFLSNAMYILNAGIGFAFMVVLAIALLINKNVVLEIVGVSAEIGGLLPALICAGLCFCSSMSCVSAPSISLEGKNLWISKSLPVSSGEILLAKARAHLWIGLPFILVSGILSIIALTPSVFDAAMLFLLPLAVTAFCAHFGVVINLHFPKFDWISETACIKQSMSVVISMFGGMVLLILPILLYLFLFKSILSLTVYLSLWFVLFTAAAAALRWYLKTAGARRFDALS